MFNVPKILFCIFHKPEHKKSKRTLPLKMLEGKAIVGETDMPDTMKSHAMELAYQALDLHEVADYQSIAHYIKQVFIIV